MLYNAFSLSFSLDNSDILHYFKNQRAQSWCHQRLSNDHSLVLLVGPGPGSQYKDLKKNRGAKQEKVRRKTAGTLSEGIRNLELLQISIFSNCGDEYFYSVHKHSRGSMSLSLVTPMPCNGLILFISFTETSEKLADTNGMEPPKFEKTTLDNATFISQCC